MLVESTPASPASSSNPNHSQPITSKSTVITVLPTVSTHSFTDAVRRGFNAIGRERIQGGHKVIPVMADPLTLEITPMKVNKLGEDYAMLSDSNGETYGVVFE